MLYDILVDFKGSQDGRFSEMFIAGTQRELSDYLAAAIDKRWARPVGSSQIENKAIVTEGRQTGTLTVRRK